jgi:hypothetical protein
MSRRIRRWRVGEMGQMEAGPHAPIREWFQDGASGSSLNYFKLRSGFAFEFFGKGFRGHAQR